jgi:hypothetical protein
LPGEQTMSKTYSINQFLSIEATIKPIDEMLNNPHTTYSPPELGEAYQARYRRMFEVIQGNPELLEDVYTYMALLTMDVECGNGKGEYISAYYDKSEMSFDDILRKRIDLFSPEDQVFIRECTEYEDYEELIECFPGTIGSFQLIEHSHNLPE